MDFFTTGRLLKQVNALLIPKVRTPHSVADFRPISCCNVIYKVISKILVCRIREILDLLISPSQNAFIPGRLISDNVLLAQELFSGYNQCRLPPRCALKVDLRKAYDTVEWDFLFATLRLFGFPAVFIRWIEECITSAHYSVVVNGGVHGFFAGARGLRQGDPMSPELKLFQLSFADDLLLLCKADVRSVSLFRRGLDVFASLSGLHTNPQKSQLIFSKAASGLRDSLLETLGFQEGHLPVRYLGLPLISARLSIADCQPLLQKIDSRIKGWEGVQLSFAGRVQLIKSVLVSLEVYWAMAFILPKGIINEMIKTIAYLLWKGTSSSGYPKVRLRDCSIWTVKENKGAWGWRKMLTLRHTLLSHIQFRVGDGTSFLLWHDPWHPLGPLITRFPRGPQMTNTGPLDKISVVMEDRQWNWPMITDIACLEITYMLPPISEGQDRISWKSNNGSFNTSTAYDLFRPGSQGCLVFTFAWSLQDPKELLYPLACYHGEIVHIG
ncbi:UNVERIFIED_CONTAM: Retrovirus-related Pol polyprotein from type-2 retrotransposable element R2DM [Sesamum radiatum]|uniref:Retrovirus-related Pol polyprotein from type-2 retrotransposable element R2DM n=1 Tax=Sesamum radiatum TaxID=300843 RepID=A0AAW2J6T8_SESRA